MRIRSSRRRDRTWVVVLASCLGVYLVLAVGFHWLLQPIVKDSESAASKLPSATFAARRRAATRAHYLMGISAQRATTPGGATVRAGRRTGGGRDFRTGRAGGRGENAQASEGRCPTGSWSVSGVQW